MNIYYFSQETYSRRRLWRRTWRRRWKAVKSPFLAATRGLGYAIITVGLAGAWASLAVVKVGAALARQGKCRRRFQTG